MGGARVTRIFHQDRITRIEQQTGDEVECLLCAGGDEHLAGLAADAASAPDVLRDRLAERCIASGISLSVKRAGSAPQDPARDARPEIHRKKVDGRFVRAKRFSNGTRGWKSRHVLGRDSASFRKGRARRWLRQTNGLPPGSQGLFGQREGDKRTRAPASLDVSFGTKVVERHHHGPAGALMVPGQAAAGRHSGAALQAPIRNRGPQFVA